MKLLTRLASAYSMALALNREPTDAQASSAFRWVATAVHPDKVKSVCSPQEAQRVATLCVLSLWKVCKDIVAKKVAATHMPREGCMSVHARLAKVAVDLNWFRGLHALCV